MPLVRNSNNQIMICRQGADMEITTDPLPMGGNDYVEALSTVHTLDNTGNTATLTFLVQESNDGVEFRDTVITINTTIITSEPLQLGGFVRAAYIRFKYTLSNDGAAADRAWTCFDVHANLSKSGS